MKTARRVYQALITLYGRRKWSVIGFVTSFVTSLVATVLHLSDIYTVGILLWLPWIVSCALFYLLLTSSVSISNYLRSISRKDWLLLVIISLLYIVSHTMNYSSAPWNNYGLFDDAAWDIYFAKNHVLTDVPFQAAYYDDVGAISREVVFHYYITAFFLLFGYNMFTFNVSLLVLGFITVLCATFIIQRLHNSLLISLISGVMINFLPFHFMHIFMGHRYAIAAPLMSISLYFLITGFQNMSRRRLVVSSYAAALCLMSAVMGKQFVAGLIMGALLTGIVNWKFLTSSKIWSMVFVWILGFVVSAMPILVYIVLRPEVYSTRESGLIQEFLRSVEEGGLIAVQDHVNALRDVFFLPQTSLRQFVGGFVLIPLPYYVFLLTGMVFSIIRKQFLWVVLSILPVIGAFISGPYDFRMLHAVPAWIVLISYGLVFYHQAIRWIGNRYVAIALTVVLGGYLLGGLIPSYTYISAMSLDPNSEYLLPHKDVAVSRLVQDIVLGVESPSIVMKQDEFRRVVSDQLYTDTFVCPYSAYAIMHVYLHQYDDQKILSFCGQGIMSLKTTEEVLDHNFLTLSEYIPTGKDLQLVWEVYDDKQDIVDFFQEYEVYGSGKWYRDQIDGIGLSVYVVTIDSENVTEFLFDILSQSHE